MGNKSRIKEVHLHVADGVTVIAEVESISELKKLVSDFKSEGFTPFEPKLGPAEQGESNVEEKEISVNDSEPAGRIEVRAGIKSGSLLKANVLAIKDDVPQLFRPNAFSTVSDAALSLLFAIEAGLKKNKIAFDDYKAIFDDQNIKSGTALSMLLNNLKNSGYIDKGMYSADRIIRLTAKGEKKAIEVLKHQVGT